MPTPDDAIVSPVEHESTTSRTTCPPDELRITTARELNESLDFNAASNVESTMDIPMQLPTPPPQEPPAHAQPPPDSHTKPANTHIEAPARDIPTPMTSIDDGAEEQRTSQLSPLSTAVPTPTSLLAGQLSSPFPAHRVRYNPPCIVTPNCSSFADGLCSLFPTAPRPSSVPAAASKAAKPLIASNTKSKSR
jgi:hypothetical protein